MLYLGLLIIAIITTDIVFEGFSVMHLFFFALGIALSIYQLGLLNFKGLFKGKKIATFSSIATKLMVIGVLVILYLVTRQIYVTSDKNIDYQIERAVQYENKSDYINAFKVLKGISDTQPDNLEIKKTMGLLYLKQTRYDEAISIFRNILNVKPSDNEAGQNLIQCYIGKKDWNNALIQSKSLVSYDPHSPIAYMDLGDIYWQMGDATRGVVYYSLAVREDQNGILPHLKLGKAYGNLHSYSEAIGELDKARERAQSDDEQKQVADALYQVQKAIDQNAQHHVDTHEYDLLGGS